ncbi:hypothetical protein ABIB75_007757 [Bradyrhizobium sp. GM2.2]
MGVILDWVGRPAHASELGRKQTEEVHSVSTAACVDRARRSKRSKQGAA